MLKLKGKLIISLSLVLASLTLQGQDKIQLDTSLVGTYSSNKSHLATLYYLLNPKLFHMNNITLKLYADSSFTISWCGMTDQNWEVVGDTLFLTANYVDTVKSYREEKGTNTTYNEKYFIEKNKKGIHLRRSCVMAVLENGKPPQKWCLTLKKQK